ncbi:MAG TPA: hypothetical protein VI072_05975 [Polyangiaceae bacterium]
MAAVALFASGSAVAEPARDRETARRLFEEAATLEAAEQWSEAIPKLRSALQLVETPGLEYHLAYCLEQQGQLTEALVHYARAEALIAAGAAAPDVQQLLATRQASLKERVPKITLVLPKDPAPTALQVDGEARPLPTSDEPLILDAGAHRIELRAAQQNVSLVRAVTIKEGQHLTLQLEWPPRRAPPPARPQAVKSAPSPSEREREAPSNVARTAVLIGSATLAVAGVGWGIAFTRAANMKADDADAVEDEIGSEQQVCRPPAEHGDCGELGDAVDGEHKYRNLALGSFVAGGVFAAATVGTWFLWKPSSSAPKAVGFGVAPTASGWALRASGRF